MTRSKVAVVSVFVWRRFAAIAQAGVSLNADIHGAKGVGEGDFGNLATRRVMTSRAFAVT
jgi:hypothetical protein